MDQVDAVGERRWRGASIFSFHRVVVWDSGTVIAHFSLVVLERELDLPEAKRLIALVEREVRNAVIVPEAPPSAASAGA